MFFGQFNHTIDEKNRLMIPRRMREEAGVKVFILKGFDGCISIYKANTFESIVEKISTLSYNLKDSRDYIRNQLASAFEIDVDKQGRIQIPTQIMNKYGLSKEVTVIGVGDHFEVWNADKYAEYEKSVDENFENIAEKIQFDK